MQNHACRHPIIEFDGVFPRLVRRSTVGKHKPRTARELCHHCRGWLDLRGFCLRSQRKRCCKQNRDLLKRKMICVCHIDLPQLPSVLSHRGNAASFLRTSIPRITPKTIAPKGTVTGISVCIQRNTIHAAHAYAILKPHAMPIAPARLGRHVAASSKSQQPIPAINKVCKTPVCRIGFSANIVFAISVCNTSPETPFLSPGMRKCSSPEPSNSAPSTTTLLRNSARFFSIAAGTSFQENRGICRQSMR